MAGTKSANLPTYTWVGTDKRGSTMKGETSAKNVNMVKAELRRQGINPKKIKKKSKPLFGSAGRKITPLDVSIFSRQLATMMQSGVPLVQSFDIIAGGSDNPRFKDMILGIKGSVEGGSTLSEALSLYPMQFDDLFVNLVKAGEVGGVLDTLLDTIATYKENIEELKGKIKKALYYPAAVMAVAFIVSVVLLVYVVPQFSAIFESFGAELPAFTQLIVNMSDWMQKYVLLVIIGFGGFVYWIMWLKKKSRKFNHFMDRISLKLPVIGNILNNSAIARFARTLATTFAAGVPLVDALETVAGACGNVVYGEAIMRIREDVSVGHQLQLAMSQVHVFPHMVIQMTAIGEEAGSLDTMLNKVADFYENEVNNDVDALSSLLEPFIMVIIGIVVGGMIVGMYLPIFKLAAVM